MTQQAGASSPRQREGQRAGRSPGGVEAGTSCSRLGEGTEHSSDSRHLATA
jgi:hypothetical protein